MDEAKATVEPGMFGDADEIKSVLVTEGDSVPLYTDVTEVREGDQILWKFGHQRTRIAEIMKRDQIGVNINFVFNGGIFKDKLQMDKHTGSLTIRNISTEHTGLYELTVISEKNSMKRFNVIVYSTLPIPFISINSLSNSSSSVCSSDSRCSVLCSVLNVSAVSLSWYKGNSVLSSISVSDLSISLSLPLEVEYQDKNTYSCVVNNTITNHTTHLDIEQLCQTCEAGGVNKHNKRASIIFKII
nr:uncharacterized protein LOC101883802 [Danio rerio]|eukprot:XP_021325365.1 uncharacterized protein LOC101883802 [Danio rerio]